MRSFMVGNPQVNGYNDLTSGTYQIAGQNVA